jgi:hypothetical protein
MPRKQPKFEYSIICDDIRQEIGNKLTFVGTYQDLIIVSKLPYSFPKLCFFVQYKDIRAGDRFLLEITDPSNKTIVKAINITVPAGKKVGKMRLFGVFSPMKVEKEGRYTLSITVNDNEKKKQEIVFAVKEVTKQK